MTKGYIFHRTIFVLSLLTMVPMSGYTISAGVTQGRLYFADDRHCVFAGREAAFPLIYDPGDTSRSPRQVQAYLQVNRRTVARGRAEFKRGQNGKSKAELKLTPPSVKEDVVLSATLEIVISPDADADDGNIRRTRNIHLFHPDPFSARQTWLEECNIRLFDPIGKTAECLEDSNIPHELILNKARIRGFTDGILLIGAGISLSKQRGLLQNALTAAEGGASVLFLGVKEGQTALPGISSTRSVQPERVVLRGDEVVKSFDKRFDVLSNPSVAESKNRPLKFKAERDHILGSFSQDEEEKTKSWDWFLAEYESGGRFAVSGMPLIGMWSSSPIPRYLLLEILKSWDAGK
ncbi:MAG: hypothetical protein ACOCZS_02875 [Verrucomicrobiota bacterium]